MIIDSIGKKGSTQCGTCKHGIPISREEFEEEMKDCGFTVSIQSEHWNCYKCALQHITKTNGVCQNREPKDEVK